MDRQPTLAELANESGDVEGAETDPIPGSPMVPAIDARWPTCRVESGMRIKMLGVVARVGIEPTTRGFSAPGWVL